MATYLKRWVNAFNRATGIRKYILVGTAFAAAGIYNLLRAYFVSKDMEILPEYPVWEIAFFIATILLAFWFLQRIVVLEKHIEPKFEFIFENRPPYNETKAINASGDLVPVGNDLNRHFQIICIGVKNSGLLSLPDCVVYINNVKDIAGRLIWESPISLHRKGPGSEVFPLRPSQEKYVAIARIDQGIEGANIIIAHTSGELDNEIPSGRYTFNIEAYASNTTPMIDNFSISINECGQLRLETDVD